MLPASQSMSMSHFPNPQLLISHHKPSKLRNNLLEVAHTFYYHIDFQGISEPNMDFQCGSEGIHLSNPIILIDNRS